MKKTEKKKPGRKAVAPEFKKSKIIATALDEAELKAVREAASIQGDKLADFLRKAALKTAGEIMNPGTIADKSAVEKAERIKRSIQRPEKR